MTTSSRPCLDELSRARRELARTEADVHAIQGHAAVFEARVQTLEMAHSCVPHQAFSVRYGVPYGHAPMQHVRSYVPEKRSREGTYKEPARVAFSRAVLPVIQAPMPAYHTLLLPFHVALKLSDNPYAASCARVGSEWPVRAEVANPAAPLHAARDEEVVGNGGDEPQRERATDQYKPAYPSHNVPWEGANTGAFQKPCRSESTTGALLRSFSLEIGNAFALPRGFRSSTMPFTGGSTFKALLPVLI